MPFVPSPDTALVETRMLYNDQKVENTIWVFNPGGAWSGADLALLAGDVLLWWGDSYAQLVADQVTLVEVVATDMSTETGGQASLSGAGNVGAQAGGGMPGNVSYAVSFRTALRGRAFRGRNYIVGVPSLQVENISHVTGDYIEAVVTQYTALLTAIAAEDWTWVVNSRFSGTDTDGKPIPRTEAVATPITNVVCADDVLDSQRRRLPGRGQ